MVFSLDFQYFVFNIFLLKNIALDDLNKQCPSEDIHYDLSLLQLTSDDIDLRPKAEDDNEDHEFEETQGVASEFERYYGTSIRAVIPEKLTPYLNFDAPSSETQAKLDELLASNQQKALARKTTLTEDIEQQFQLQPFRTSKRQRKRQNASERSKTLGAGWFNMPRVAELTKEQEKDLTALKMRRVWNPKNFYKKNSAMLEESSQADSGAAPSDGAKFFQIGTVVESKTDFYNDRLPKKQRKQTIIDELMNDQELRAYNKRKLKYAMAKNGRLRQHMLRAKQKRAKKRLKSRKEAKMNKSFGPEGKRPQVNTFKTYDF